MSAIQPPIRVLLISENGAVPQLRRDLDKLDKDTFEIILAPGTKISLKQLTHFTVDVCLITTHGSILKSIEFLKNVRENGIATPILLVVDEEEAAFVDAAFEGGASDVLLLPEATTSLLIRLIKANAIRGRAASVMAREHFQFRAIVDNLPDYIYIKGTDGRFIMDNMAHARLCGAASPAEIVGKTVYDLHPRQLADVYHEGDMAVMRTGAPIIDRDEQILSHENNQTVWVSTTKVPLRNTDGSIIGLVGMGRDITRRRQAEEQRDQSEEKLRGAHADLERSHAEVKTTQEALIEMERMTSLGRLAAGIAHEVKNPLSQLILAAGFLGQSSAAKGDAILQKVVGHISEAAGRIDRIVDGMLDFTSPNKPELCPCDISEILEQSLVLLKMELLKSHVEVVKNYATGLQRVLVDPNRLKQVFVNLYLNAIEAMKERGTITITTRSKTFAVSERAEWQRHGWFRAGDVAVVVDISDTGPGIAPEKLAVIFDPFVTTKEAGKGAGLGLTISKKIVELHNGRIEIRNGPEGGAVASLYLKTARSEPLSD